MTGLRLSKWSSSSPMELGLVGWSRRFLAEWLISCSQRGKASCLSSSAAECAPWLALLISHIRDSEPAGPTVRPDSICCNFASRPLKMVFLTIGSEAALDRQVGLGLTPCSA